ncbi:DNA-binding domain-containing protein [Methylococcus sp. EFPC2]|uniref:HvfC/BufC N-terminal domain-containing protein n=1 Tax=Methylococcus sp. EFPC2 TaxID=2812648 RepID=UPI0019675025|nr:DNA-binding domain-containing protein [Methylococcus sp. EFPC2]QSA98913.1 putative DNA-binding domain-containing protein [Methylococcus sp. EFPC2]
MGLKNEVPLAELQRRFQAAVLSGEPGAPGFVAAETPEAAEQRFRVYHDAYRLRLAEALGADYPALRAVMGAGAFAELAYAYAETVPSRHYSIRWAGASLAERLSGHPGLADLARFEWALSLAFDAADASPLEVAALSAVPLEHWPDLRLHFHASLQIFELRHDVAPLWRAATDDAALPEMPAEENPRPWLVWRRGLSVYYRVLDDNEGWALQTASKGASFADWCEELSLRLDGGADAATVAASLLRRWVDDELVVAYECGSGFSAAPD